MLTQPLSAEDLGQWLKQLLLKLLLARGVDTPAERYAYFLQQLLEDGFTEAQKAGAQLWILRGNWKFRGSKPVLELSDFYPEKEELEKLNSAKVYYLVSCSDLGSELQKEYQRGRDHERNAQVQQERTTGEYQTLTSFLREHTQKQAQTLAELDREREKRTKLEERVERLLSKLAAAEDKADQLEDPTAIPEGE